VIQTLVDVVSKNGNFLLNIPVRADGTIDELEMAVVKETGNRMKVNSEAVYGTRPWKIYGEGPVMATAAPLNAQGFNEGKNTNPLAQKIFALLQKEIQCMQLFLDGPIDQMWSKKVKQSVL